jgi:hypothetical protein
LDYEANSIIPVNAEVRNAWRYMPIPPYLHGMHRSSVSPLWENKLGSTI